MSGPRRFRSPFFALALAAVAGCDPGVPIGDTDPGPQQAAVETDERAPSGQPASCLDRCFRRQAACERKAPADALDPAANQARAGCAIEWSECLARCLNGPATPSLPAAAIQR
jgi:hypothetical protein